MELGGGGRKGSCKKEKKDLVKGSMLKGGLEEGDQDEVGTGKVSCVPLLSSLAPFPRHPGA